MAVLHVKSPNGTTDEAMLLANNQTVTGLKTFNTDRLRLGDVGKIVSTNIGADGETCPQLIITANPTSNIVNVSRPDEPGAHIFLHQYAQDGNGGVHFVASDGTNYCGLDVDPTGIFWNGVEIDINGNTDISSITSNVDYMDYTRYGNGLQICTGSDYTASNYIGSVAFPMPFIQNPRIFGSVHGDTSNDLAFKVQNSATTGFTFLTCSKDGFQSGVWVKWIAIGSWK